VPPLIRRYVKTSFAFLLAGAVLGAYIVIGEVVWSAYPPRLHVTAHVHLLLVGFMLMLVMGVATWMFPRPARDDRRYRPELATAVYWVMAGGTAVRAAAELVAPWAGGQPVRLLIVAGGLAQVLGTVLFVVNMWSRVRMPAAAPPAR
jgi:cbb3-type cytochrome oxidase subunit 1